jgi:hypothetical protein
MMLALRILLAVALPTILWLCGVCREFARKWGN